MALNEIGAETGHKRPTGNALEKIRRKHHPNGERGLARVYTGGADPGGNQRAGRAAKKGKAKAFYSLA